MVDFQQLQAAQAAIAAMATASAYQQTLHMFGVANPLLSPSGLFDQPCMLSRRHFFPLRVYMHVSSFAGGVPLYQMTDVNVAHALTFQSYPCSQSRACRCSLACTLHRP
jgi:hypothetical protein